MMAFHWLSYNSVSLTEWLPGEEKTLLLSAGSSGVEKYLPVGHRKYFTSCLE